MTIGAKLLILVSALFLVDVYSTYTYSWFTLGRLNHFVKKPSDGILVGGRLTTRQVAEIAEAGFKSFVSTVNFSTSDLSFNGIDGDFPSSVKESEIISGYGLKYSLFPAALTIASVTELSDLLINLPKPVSIHCNVSFFLKNLV